MEYIDDYWAVASFNITALYEYGVSKTSVSLLDAGAVVMSPAPTNTGPEPGSHSFIPNDPVLVAGIVALASFVLIGSIYLVDRRMRSPPT